MINALKHLNNQRGSQVIEFMAVFPLVIFAFLFIWQMALGAYSYVVAENSARDGARVAAVSENHGAISDAVHEAAYGLEVESISAPVVSSTAHGEEVHLSVDVQMATIDVPFIGELDFTMTGEATMPYELQD